MRLTVHLLRLILLTTLFSLLGCTRLAPATEPVTITFVCPESYGEYYGNLLQKFHEQYPHITVELRPVPWQALDDLGADDVDVLVVPLWYLRTLQSQGDLLNLDPFVEEDKSLETQDFHPGTLELFSIENHIWGIPAGIDLLVMFYNRDLFDRKNLPYPQPGWTQTDFLEAASSISDPEAGIYGYVPMAWGFPGNISYFDAALFVYLRGGRLFDDLQEPTRTAFDDPLTVDAVKWYTNLYLKYAAAPTPEEARRAFGGGRDTYYVAVQQGKAGLWIGSLSERGGTGWPAEWNMNWGVTTLPRDALFFTQALPDGYAIYAETGEPEACWELIKFLTRQTHYLLVPPRRSVTESALYEQQVGAEVAATARASMENAFYLADLRRFGEFEAAMRLFGRAITEVLNGNLTVEEAMHQAQQQANPQR
jgi:multiple sugar transport system substrate-binding protein